LFEELGMNYIGPVDGHDVDVLLKTLGNVRDLPGPQFLHIVTRKGKGYAPAEADPIAWHGPGPFDPQQRRNSQGAFKGQDLLRSSATGCATWPKQDERLVGITPAMREGSGMVEFRQRFPERYFDVGICEQHAVTLAAGMACENTHGPWWPSTAASCSAPTTS
jgi:1-deoxy-D-xylulose-5-phosphate synthase